MAYDAPKPKPDNAMDPIPANATWKLARRKREPEPVRALSQSLEERACSGLTYPSLQQRRRSGFSSGGY